jgi:hypothetical protein
MKRKRLEFSSNKKQFLSSHHINLNLPPVLWGIIQKYVGALTSKITNPLWVIQLKAQTQKIEWLFKTIEFDLSPLKQKNIHPTIQNIITYFKNISQLTCTFKMTNSNLAHLSPLTQLLALDLSNCRKTTNEGLIHLSHFTRLQSLNLSRCIQFTFAGLAHLSQLTQLKTLNLSMCHNLTNVDLFQLSKLTQLQTLNLSYCYKITDAGLAQFISLTQLQSLSLCFCVRISDVG